MKRKLDIEPSCQEPDLISCLNDDILGDIITLLPTKDGARTQVLSRRWRRLWRCAPLNFEAMVAGSNANVVVATILSTLQAHKGIVRRLSLTWHYNYNYFSMVDSLLESPRLNSLQEFELFFSYNVNEYQVPRSVLRWSPTLRVLNILTVGEVLKFPMETACCFHFPHLKQLTLNGVSISEGTIHAILSGCPVLESLVLDGNIGYRCLRISSATLRSLGVSDAWNYKEVRLEQVIIEDAPQLERLVPRPPKCDDLEIRIVKAPKLKTLGYLSKRISTFEMGTMIFQILFILFQKMVLVGHPNPTRTVKILALNTDPNLDAFIQGRFKNVRHYVSLECLDLHLKMVEFINYQGSMSDVKFIKFFLLNSRVLESMKFVARRHECDAKWVQEQHKKLQLNERASQGVTFDFRADYRSSCLVHLKHINDLTTDDPFDTSLCRCTDEDFI
ncbi:hypothetical protein HU200_041072 [Digitaria exilis]|uniref:FBD domain-containing protein n=1 Tax=Digitaria exilis TaxID=1010633 RepID=A0A835B705_9POAL|nr:hypothetical protein HU200_041072 [Digitaria exilis]